MKNEPVFQQPVYLQTSIEQVLMCLRDHKYCALIGPRYAGKSTVLKFVQAALQNEVHLDAIYVDLYEVDSSRQTRFFTNLYNLIAQQVGSDAPYPYPINTNIISNGVAFTERFDELLLSSPNKLILLIDHLESVPNDILHVLLTSLRKLYQQVNPRLLVVTSGALSLAAATQGEVSPFRNIARSVVVDNFGPGESAQLMEELLKKADLMLSENAKSTLLAAGLEDNMLINILCSRIIEHAPTLSTNLISKPFIQRIVNNFLENDAVEYPPLQEGLRIVEDDFHLLRAILKLIEEGSVPRNQLQLEFSPDLDALYLTGLIRKGSTDADYQIRNDIYYKFLKNYFRTGKVGQLFMAMGRWEHAIGHFAESIRQGQNDYQIEFLSASTNAMYAANNLTECGFYLNQGLTVAFSLDEIQIWNLSDNDSQLELIYPQIRTTPDIYSWPSVIRIEDDRLEAHAFKEKRPLQGKEDDRCIQRAFPLSPNNSPIGIVSFCQKQRVFENLDERRNYEIQLVSYLHQCARALDEVRGRKKDKAILAQQDDELKQKTRLLSLINRAGNLTLTLNDINKVFHLILTCITANFGLGFNRAWLFLAQDQPQCLKGKMAIGDINLEKAYLTWERVGALTFDDYVKQLLKDQIEYSDIDAKVKECELPLNNLMLDPVNESFFQHKTTYLSIQPDILGTPLGTFMQKFDIQKAVAVPLLAQEKCLGVILADNRFNYHDVIKLEEEMLIIFANLAAAANLNASLRSEEKKRRKLAEALGQAALLVSEPFELDQVLGIVLDQMAEILPFESATIQLFDDNSQTLRIEANKGFRNSKLIEKKEFPLYRDKYPNVAVFEDKVPIKFSNIQEVYPHFGDPQFAVTQIKGWLGVPLIANDRVLGVITLDSTQTDAYTQEHVEVAQRFAGNVSLLIRNAIFLTFQKERSVRLELMRQSSEEATRLIGRPVKDALEKIAMSLCKVLNADSVIIYPYRGEHKVYDVRNIGSYNLLVNKDFSFKIRQDPMSMLSVVLQSDEPLVVEDIETKKDRTGMIPIWMESDSFLKRESIISFVGYKLQVDDNLVGTLFVNFRQLHKFSAIELETIKIFASQAASAVQQARSFEIAKKDHLVLQAAQAITTTVGQKNEIVWDTFLRHAADVTGAEKGRILLKRDDGLKEVSALAINSGDRTTISNHGSGPCKLLRMALESDKSILIVDSSLEAVPDCCSQIFARYRSLLVTPIFNPNRTDVIAILLLANRVPFSFTQVDQKLMDDLANFATIVIQSNEGIDESRAHIKLQESLLGASKGMVSIQELEKTLQQIANLVHDTLVCDVVSLYPYKPELDNFELPYISGDIYDINSVTALNKVSKNSVIWRLMEKGRLVKTENAEQNEEFNSRFGKVDRRKGVKPFVEREKIRSAASIPLIMGHEKLGILFINFRSLHNFKDSEIKVIELFAELASIAIHNSRMYDLQSVNQAHLEAVYDASKIITVSVGMDQQKIMESILEQAIESISGKTGPKASFGTFHRFDSKKNILVLESVYPKTLVDTLNLQKIKELYLSPKGRGRKPKGIIVKAALKGEGLLVRDAPSNPDYIACSPNTRSELAVLVKGNLGELIGVLDIESDKPDGLDESDMKALNQLAELAKTALQNSEMGEKLARTSTIAVMAAWQAERTHENNRNVQDIQLAIGELLARQNIPADELEMIHRIQVYTNYLALPVFPLPLGNPSKESLSHSSMIYDPGCPDAIITTEIKKFKRDNTWLKWVLKLGCSETKVNMHEQWIRIIFKHLVNNALRFISKDQQKRQITIKTWQEESWLMVDVTDTGSGIDEETCKRLFRGQINQAGNLGGRGLLLVHFLMEQHGGSIILAATKIGIGTTFQLKFPIQYTDED